MIGNIPHKERVKRDEYQAYHFDRMEERTFKAEAKRMLNDKKEMLE